MTIEKFKELGDKWKELNAEYDAYIEKIIDNQSSIDIDMEKLKSLQKELFDLENEITNFK